MKKLTKREIILLIIVVVLIALYFFITYVYTPISKDVEELKLESESVSAQVKNLYEKEDLISDLSEQVEDLQKDFNKNHKDIFSVWDDPELLNYLENVADSDSTIKGIEFADPVELNGYCTGDVKIGIVTDYSNLKKIMSEYEKNKYFNTVVSVSVSKEAMNSGVAADPDTKVEVVSSPDNSVLNEDSLNVDLVLRFYSQKTIGKYPGKYNFMNDDYGKEDIFNE